jgi:concanavalin A-like lectin/glucanase superfamily protein
MLTGAASFTSPGIEGGAVSQSRSGNGLVNFGPNLFPSGPFSVQIWVDTTDTTASVPVAYHTSTVVAGYFIGINNVSDGCNTPIGSAEFYVAYPCSGNSATLVNDGRWHQLVGVYNGNTAAIYVDGQFQSASAGGNSLITPPTTTDFLLGGITAGVTPGNSYQGLVSDLQLYDNALSASDVLALYENAITPTHRSPLRWHSSALVSPASV